MTRSLYMSGEPEADRLLATDPLALLIGMLLDQQVPMETAFAGPQKLAERMDGLDVHAIAEAEPEPFAAMCATPPAVHRYPGSMAARIQKLATEIIDRYDGRPEAIWTEGDPDGAEILRRLKALPGYGDQKAKIFLALLGKQFDLQAPGWAGAAGDYGKPGARMSIADVVDGTSLGEVREYKRQQKADAKRAAGPG